MVISCLPDMNKHNQPSELQYIVYLLFNIWIGQKKLLNKNAW